jgi:hypothetical protein
MARAHKAYHGPRRKRLPVTSAIRDELGMVLHTSLACLGTNPNAGVFDNLAGIFNMIQLALEHDARHQHEARLINGGAAALIQFMSKVDAGRPLVEHESAPIRVGVVTIEAVIGKLDALTLFNSMQRLGSTRHR